MNKCTDDIEESKENKKEGLDDRAGGHARYLDRYLFRISTNFFELKEGLL